MLDIGLGWKPGTAKSIVEGTAPEDPDEWVATAVTAYDTPGGARTGSPGV